MAAAAVATASLLAASRLSHAASSSSSSFFACPRRCPDAILCFVRLQRRSSPDVFRRRFCRMGHSAAAAAAATSASLGLTKPNAVEIPQVFPFFLDPFPWYCNLSDFYLVALRFWVADWSRE